MEAIMQVALAFSLFLGSVWPIGGSPSVFDSLQGEVVDQTQLVDPRATAALSAAALVVASSPTGQVLDARSFRTARFGLAGTIRYDGVSVDISGDGQLQVPNQLDGSFKVGPLTAEVVLVDDAVYGRSRFDRQWSRQLIPAANRQDLTTVAENQRLLRDVRRVGTELVGGVTTEHYTAAFDLRPLFDPQLRDVDRDTRRALETLRASVDYWIGAQDRVIRQERFILTVNLPAIEPEGEEILGVLDLTTAYTRIDEPVSIEAPPQTDPRPIRSPQPGVTALSGPAGTPALSGRGPAGPAPAQVPGR